MHYTGNDVYDDEYTLDNEYVDKPKVDRNIKIWTNTQRKANKIYYDTLKVLPFDDHVCSMVINRYIESYDKDVPVSYAMAHVCVNRPPCGPEDKKVITYNREWCKRKNPLQPGSEEFKKQAKKVLEAIRHGERVNAKKASSISNENKEILIKQKEMAHTLNDMKPNKIKKNIQNTIESEIGKLSEHEQKFMNVKITENVLKQSQKILSSVNKDVEHKDDIGGNDIKTNYDRQLFDIINKLNKKTDIIMDRLATLEETQYNVHEKVGTITDTVVTDRNEALKQKRKEREKAISDTVKYYISAPFKIIDSVLINPARSVMKRIFGFLIFLYGLIALLLVLGLIIWSFNLIGEQFPEFKSTVYEYIAYIGSYAMQKGSMIMEFLGPIYSNMFLGFVKSAGNYALNMVNELWEYLTNLLIHMITNIINELPVVQTLKTTAGSIPSWFGF